MGGKRSQNSSNFELSQMFLFLMFFEIHTSMILKSDFQLTKIDSRMKKL